MLKMILTFKIRLIQDAVKYKGSHLDLLDVCVTVPCGIGGVCFENVQPTTPKHTDLYYRKPWMLCLAN